MIDQELFELTDNKVKLNFGDSYDFLKKCENESIDLIITSPPYCMGKEYEKLSDDINSFILNHEKILPEIVRVLKKGGSVCWQVGYHVKDAAIVPLDILVYNIISDINKNLDMQSQIILRNRIVWTFGHGLHSEKRLSGRHETILWFTKGDNYKFNLDEIRIPQKYPGKTHHKGNKKGEFSGNPKGKNPSDVWEEMFEDVWSIPNVKSNHLEKTEHPCQFPSAIPIRLIRALTDVNDIVFDPFMGSGTTALASLLTGRRFIGGELDERYFNIAKTRILNLNEGKLILREDKPVQEPNLNQKVAQKPDNFK